MDKPPIKNVFCTILLLTFLVSFSRVAYANSQDNELFEFGIVITYAGLCIKNLNIREDAQSQQDDQQLLQALMNRYGVEKLANLEAVAVMGIQEYESDNGARCRQFLQTGKKMLNNLGVRGILIQRALNKLNNG